MTAMTRAAALLLLRLLGGAVDFRTGLLGLGARATGVAVGDTTWWTRSPLNSRPLNTASETDTAPLPPLMLSSMFRLPLLVGRTITSPPGAPGPRRARRSGRARRRPSPPAEVLRGLGFVTHVARHLLARNTRPGVWRWPIEPGERCDSELPCVASPMVKFQRLIVPLEALALGDALDVDIFWPTSKMSALISPPTS